MPEYDNIGAAMESVGGARIGYFNVTWPLAKLKANAEELSVGVAMYRNYRFRPDQVIAISRRVIIPLLGSGIRIEHNVADYPAKVIFWCNGKPDDLLVELGRSGFTPQAAPESVRRDSGFPWTMVGFLLLVCVVVFGAVILLR